MSDWTRIQMHDTVELRAKRSVDRRTVDVVELLEPKLGDGRGFVGSDGQEYRYFYWDLIIKGRESGRG
jgi:hypothetical protein